MSPLELLAPETAKAVPYSVRLAERQAVPYSVRLAERQLTARAQAASANRRAHERRSARNLDWLQTVRLTGGTGYDVRLVDLSEGGALLEVNSPLRPGLILTLEMTGAGLDAAVPLEVVRCYISNLCNKTATYRGAVAFANLIRLPGPADRPARVAADFVGTAATLALLFEQCRSSREVGASGISLERKQVLDVLDALRMRTSARGSDLLSRHASDLLAAILPALHVGAPGDVALAALEERLRGLPPRWRSLMQPIVGRLAGLIDHCVTADAVASHSPDDVVPPVIWNNPLAPAVPSAALQIAPQADAAQADSGLQKIVVRYADGKIFKGYTQDFYATRQQFSLWPSIIATPKERIVVPMSQLKAVFFVRNFEGNPDYREREAFAPNAQGRRVEVTFADGENVVGTTLNYRPDGEGFFVTPQDPDANNTRIYVFAKAVRRVRFL